MHYAAKLQTGNNLNHRQLQQFLLETKAENGDVLYCIRKVKKKK
jgi:hypothetical protein